MNSLSRVIVFVLIAFAVSGCKSRKTIAPIAITNETVVSYWDNQMGFSNIEARGKATVTMNGKTNNVSMHLKMKKDSVIWGKFSLFGFGASILITQDSFFMVDNINQQYMAYNNSYLDQFLGFKAEVGQVQNLLLGNAIFDREKYKLNMDMSGMKASEGIATNTLDFNDVFRTLFSNISTPDTTQSADIQYDKYEKFNQSLMPKIVNIKVRKGDQKIQAVLNYQNINANPNLTFPFKIPNGFRRK